MFDLLVTLGFIVAIVVCLTFIFVFWTIRSINSLKKNASNQETELKNRNAKILRLQNLVNKLESRMQNLQISPPPLIAEVCTSEQTDYQEEQIEPTKQAAKTSVPFVPEQPAKIIDQADLGDEIDATPPWEKTLPLPSSIKSSPSLNPSHKNKTSESSNQDIESIIGANLMSQMGALLLIIGIALFLKYSLDAMGPFAKLSAAAILGGLLLAWGIFQSRGKIITYPIIGLIGGGWGILYLCAFSSYSIEATKIFDSPSPSVFLMLLVVGGMVFHSLKFDSEKVTGFSFLFGFIALLASPISLLSEVSGILLTIGMIIIAYKKNWTQLGTSGMILAYGSMLVRLLLAPSPSKASGLKDFYFLESMLVTNWLAFEAISMIFIRKNRGKDKETTKFIFIMNFFALCSLSLLMWPKGQIVSYSYLAGLIVALYFITGMLRAFWCAFPGEGAVENQNYFLGTFEDCLVIIGASGTLLLWYIMPPLAVAIGWSLLGLALIEMACRAPWQLLRFTGHVIMAIAFSRVFIANFPAEGSIGPISYRLISTLPIIALMIHLYFRTDASLPWESSPTGGTKAFAPVYSYFAVTLFAFLIRFEAGAGLIPISWGILAILLLLASQKLDNKHFARQAILLAFGATGYAFSTDLTITSATNATYQWVVGITFFVSMALCRWISSMKKLSSSSASFAILDDFQPQVYSFFGSICFAFLLYLKVSGGYLTLAWATMGIALLASGFYIKERFLRLEGLSITIVCIFKIFLYDARSLEAPYRILSFIFLGATLILISWAYSRFKDKLSEIL